LGLMTLAGSRYLRFQFENAHSILRAGWRGSLWTDALSAFFPSVPGRVPNCVTTGRLLVQSRSGVAWSRRKVRFFQLRQE